MPCRLLQMDSIPELTLSAERCQRDELFDEDTAVCFDDSPRCQVVRLRRELHVPKALAPGIFQQISQRACRVASPLSPRNDRVADMPEAGWRERLGTRLPSKPDAATEFTVPHPAAVARQPGSRGSVEHHNRRTRRGAVNETREKRVCVRLDAAQLVLSGELPAHVVRRPPALEGSDVARQVSPRGPDQL